MSVTTTNGQTPGTFFADHTYAAFPGRVSNDACEHMTREMLWARKTRGCYRSTPKVWDRLAQTNTTHIDTNNDAPTRKYCAIYGDVIRESIPSVIALYNDPDLIKLVSDTVGCQVHTVPTHRTVDLSVQMYSEEGDGASWHHDRSVFNGGRVFTVLLVPFNTSDQKLCVWTDKYKQEQLVWEAGMLVVIEKFKTFHSVTPLKSGSRILLTMTYSERPYSPSMLRPIEYGQNKVKNFAYLGTDSFTRGDWTVIAVVSSLVVLIIVIRCVSALRYGSRKRADTATLRRKRADTDTATLKRRVTPTAAQRRGGGRGGGRGGYFVKKMDAPPYIS